MMTRIRLILALSGAGMLAAAGAAAQDAPPPGCRWQGYQGDTVLACKDGKGHWRRSGDDMIVGTYPLPKPKPKQVVAAKAPESAATAAVTPAPQTPAGEQAGTPALAQGAAAQATDAAAPSAAGAATEASEAKPAAAESAPEPPAKAPWWKAIWEALLAFLRLIGLLR